MADRKDNGAERSGTEPATRILAFDGEINRLVLRVELLEARRRRAEQTTKRNRIARQIRTQQKMIAKLYSAISRAQADSPVGAVALLRPVPATSRERPGDGGKLSIAGRVADSALVVEENAE